VGTNLLRGRLALSCCLIGGQGGGFVSDGHERHAP